MWRKLGATAAATLTLGTGGVFAADAKINPYEDKGTHYELPIKTNIQQGERVEIAKDHAAITLKGWNDEYAITVTPQIPTATLGARDRPFTVEADRPLLSKKLEFTEGDVTAFIEPKEGTENQFDIDFTLASKPDTNVFTYKIEGADDFDFFYQPPLSAEEISNGVSQPDNVTGSYAVYHKNKANYAIGHTNYATGKIAHIYRPKVVDAIGKQVWAELLVKQELMSVTIPHDFLETATYPITVDPTFGYSSTPGTSIGGTLNNITCMKGTASLNGSVAGIYVYTSSAGQNNVKGITVASSTLTILTDGITPTQKITTNLSWQYVPYSTSPTVTSGTSYLACFTADNTDVLRYRDAAGYAFIDTTNSYTSPSDPTDGSSSSGSSLGIYAVYMDSNTYTNTAGSDIGFCYQDGTASCFTGATNPSSNARMGYRSGANFLNITTGFRFANITIPQGATINTATFTYTAQDTDSTNAPTVSIHAEDVDNSPTFTNTGANSPDTTQFGGSRATTTSAVSWTLSNQTNGNEYTSPDISSLIQQVINRAGWTSGNALSILLGPTTQVDNFNARNSTSTAFLTITYTASAATTNTTYFELIDE